MAIIDAAVSWLHLLAAVIWIGGMVFSLMVVMPALTAIDPPPLRGKLMGAVVRRFTPIAWAAIAVLVLTGLAITIRRIPSPAALVGSTYGIVLLVKIVVAIAMVAIAAIMGLVLNPRLTALSLAPPAMVPGGQSSAGGPPAGPPPQVLRLQSQQVALAKTNLVLGMLMIVVVVVIRWV